MEVLTGKSSINGPFSMAMLHNQRVYIYIYCNRCSIGNIQYRPILKIIYIYVYTVHIILLGHILDIFNMFNMCSIGNMSVT